jgi:hypothetical protein
VCWLNNQCVLFLNSTLDNGWLYLATGTMPVSNDFPRALCLGHRFSRVIFIYFCQDLSPLMNKLQVMQTENRSKNTFSYPEFNFSNCNVTINYQQWLIHTEMFHFNILNKNLLHVLFFWKITKRCDLLTFIFCYKRYFYNVTL